MTYTWRLDTLRENSWVHCSVCFQYSARSSLYTRSFTQVEVKNTSFLTSSGLGVIFLASHSLTHRCLNALCCTADHVLELYIRWCVITCLSIVLSYIACLLVILSKLLMPQRSCIISRLNHTNHLDLDRK